MWVLLSMSIVSVTLIIERIFFWARTNSSSQLVRVARMTQHLREGQFDSAKVLAQDDQTVYGRIVMLLVSETYTDALAVAAVESQRPRFDKYMATLSTMITAAPLAGLLGTVTGLITAFHFFSDQTTAADPRSVGLGLSEALLNTAAGLVVAVITIFPFNAFRVQIDRTLGRVEALFAAAAAGQIKRNEPAPK